MRVIKQLIHQINCPTLYGYSRPDDRIRAEKIIDDSWWLNRA